MISAEYCPAVMRYSRMIIDDTTTPNSTVVSNTTIIAVDMARNCIPVRITGLVRATILARQSHLLSVPCTDKVGNGDRVGLSSETS